MGSWKPGNCGTNVISEAVQDQQLLTLDCGLKGLFELDGVKPRGEQVFRDDLTGQVLPSELVKIARQNRQRLPVDKTLHAWAKA